MTDGLKLILLSAGVIVVFAENDINLADLGWLCVVVAAVILISIFFDKE